MTFLCSRCLPNFPDPVFVDYPTSLYYLYMELFSVAVFAQMRPFVIHNTLSAALLTLRLCLRKQGDLTYAV